MITLAFDTCLDKMYAVLKKDNEILASKIVENKDNNYHDTITVFASDTAEWEFGN